MTEHEALTENEIKLLQTPINHLRQTGQIPSALSALERKNAIARAEKEREKNRE